VGQTKAVYDLARKAGRDVRIHRYEPRHLHALMAFTPWLQVASAEVESAREHEPNAEAIFRAFLGNLFKELVGWIDSWRQPAPARKEVLA
jgi:hypothetical protein